MKKSVLAIMALALCTLSFAEAPSTATINPQPETAAVEVATGNPNIIDQCAFTFSSGHDESFLKYCVTVNGNIIQLETPHGHEHLLFAANGGWAKGMASATSMAS